MRAGKMRHRISIQESTAGRGAFGQVTEASWTELLTTWSRINVANAKDVYAGGAGFTSQVTHKITIRHQPLTIKAGMRVSYENRTFTIQAVSDPDEMKRETDLLCLEETK